MYVCSAGRLARHIGRRDSSTMERLRKSSIHEKLVFIYKKRIREESRGRKAAMLLTSLHKKVPALFQQAVRTHELGLTLHPPPTPFRWAISLVIPSRLVGMKLQMGGMTWLFQSAPRSTFCFKASDQRIHETFKKRKEEG